MPKTPKAAIPGSRGLRPAKSVTDPLLPISRTFLLFGDYDGDGEVKSAFEEIGTLGDPVLGDSGLFGQLKAALHDAGIDYDPNTYPYFFVAGTTDSIQGLDIEPALGSLQSFVGL